MTKANSNPWQPAALDAEFSPQVAELLRADHGRRELSSRVRSRDEGLRTAVKKHLLALGWTILSTPNAAMLTRLRYKAPGDGGRSYCSLPDLVVDRAASPHLIVDSDRAAADDGDPQFQQQHNNEPPPPPAQTKDDSRREQEEGDDEEEDDSSREQEEGDDEEEDDRDWEQEEGHDEEEDDSSREQEEGDDEAEDKDQKKDAVIAEYIALMAKNYRASGPRANRLRDSAKSHLLASGWTFWMKLKSSGKEELRYKAPTGRSYISLHTACQAFMATASASNGSKIDRRRRVHVTPAAVLRAVRPTGKKRELSELIGDDAVKDVTMNRCTTIRKKKEMVRADGTQVTKKSITTTTLTRTRSRREDQARVLRPNSTGTASACQRRSRTLLSVLIDRGILVPRDKVTYWAARDGPAAKYGFITGEGIIRCTCCNKTFTVAELEAHATGGIGTDDRREAWARVFLIKDGRSLSQCLVELMRRDVAAANRNGNGGVRVKEKCSEEEGDSVCSVCIDGGELLLCDKCPSAFHHACVGLQATPEGDWCCPLCRCGVCGGSDSHLDDTAEEGFTDKTIIYCEQCEREYHVGCVRRRGGSDSEEESAAEWCRRLSEEQEEWRPWLCSPECGEVFRHLQGLAALSRARSIPTTVEGVSLSTLRRRRRRRHMSTATRWQQEEEDAAEHGQLCAALDVLHECFDDMKEPRTQTDLTADIVFNRESGLRRLNFRGYYVVGLEKAGELITVGTLRVFGKQVAELPLVGTRFAHRRRGMCHLLVTELEKMLRRVGVRRLVLPAVPELLPMWTASLGFHAMTHSDVMEMAAEHAILSFQGTTMCQKTLLA